jgi:hypothetical protein
MELVAVKDLEGMLIRMHMILPAYPAEPINKPDQLIRKGVFLRSAAAAPPTSLRGAEGGNAQHVLQALAASPDTAAPAERAGIAE